MTDFAMPVGLYEKALPADLAWEERLSTAAEAGYDFMDISIDESDCRLARLDWSASKRAALCRAIANTGVSVMAMCLSAHRKYPLGSHVSEVRRQGLDILRKAIEFAGDIGLRIVQVMGYDVFYEPSDDGTKARFLEGIQQGVRWAGQAGVMLGLENVDNPFLESLEKGLCLVHEVNSPWLHLYPDMGNLAAASYYPPDEILLARGHLLAIHVKDALPGVIRGVPFESGIVPLAETFQALAQVGFWGPLGIEMWAAMDEGGDPLSSVIAARKLVARLVATAWPECNPPDDDITNNFPHQHIAKTA
jgi:L-ribulose-5-phosphate 3-epimerase